MQSSRPVPEAAAAVGDILNSSEYKDIQLEACPCGAAAGLGSAEHPGGCSGGAAACVFHSRATKTPPAVPPLPDTAGSHPGDPSHSVGLVRVGRAGTVRS